jgi:hypothetical protein
VADDFFDAPNYFSYNESDDEYQEDKTEGIRL